MLHRFTAGSTAIVFLLSGAPALAATIFESALLGPPDPTGDGFIVTDTQYLGARFEITIPTQIDAVGGHMRGEGSLFAAIERLSAAGALPSGVPFAQTVATTVFSPPSTQSDFSTPLSALLQPGSYALVFGTGRFGASGFGVMPFTNTDLPGASYFHWRGGPDIWVDGGIQNVRFFASGSVAVVTARVDIRPGEGPNNINLSERGRLPVAVLGSGTFDVTQIDPSTVALGSASLATRGPSKAPKLAYSIDDVNGDGRLDFIGFFDVEQLVAIGALTSSTTALALTGALLDGTMFEGTDAVTVVP